MSQMRTLVHALLLLLVAVGVPASAATLTILNINDSGGGSLRAALALAVAGDTLVFAPGVTGTIALTSTLSVAESVAIQGPGSAALVLDGQSTVRVIDIAAGKSLTLSGVTIANGNNAGLGGGIQVAGTLTVSQVVFAGNAAGNGGAIAVLAGGVLTVDGCTFHGNVTTGVGGGGILTAGTATVRNTTFTSNTAPINGAAINVQGTGTLMLTNSTLFNNQSLSQGGALSNLGTTLIFDSTLAGNRGLSGAAVATGNANVTIYNSVFADNAATGGVGAFFGGPPTASHNVFYNNTNAGVVDDATGYGTSNFVAAPTEPLAALGDYGGLTQTMPPLLGSAAICAGSVALLPSGLTQDQRGLPRTVVSGSTTCVDAGAVQTQQPVITNGPPPSGTLGVAYTFTYTANGTPVTFTVTSGSLPPGLALSAGGVISGTPTSAGLFAATISASNGVAPDATQAFTIAIAVVPAGLPGTPVPTLSTASVVLLAALLGLAALVSRRGRGQRP